MSSAKHPAQRAIAAAISSVGTTPTTPKDFRAASNPSALGARGDALGTGQTRPLSRFLHLRSVSASRYAFRKASRPASDSEVLASDPPRRLVPNVRVEWSPLKSGVAVGAWRAPRHCDQAFAVESLAA